MKIWILSLMFLLTGCRTLVVDHPGFWLEGHCPECEKFPELKLGQFKEP